jgi:hypothetical protein
MKLESESCLPIRQELPPGNITAVLIRRHSFGQYSEFSRPAAGDCQAPEAGGRVSLHCPAVTARYPQRTLQNLNEISCSEEGWPPHLGIGALGGFGSDRGRDGDVNQQGQGKAQNGQD